MAASRRMELVIAALVPASSKSLSRRGERRSLCQDEAWAGSPRPITIACANNCGPPKDLPSTLMQTGELTVARCRRRKQATSARHVRRVAILTNPDASILSVSLGCPQNPDLTCARRGPPRSFHAQVHPNSAIRLSRKEWHSTAVGAVLSPIPGAKRAQRSCPAGLMAEAGLRWCGATPR